MKKSLRKSVSKVLNSLSEDVILAQSNQLAQRAFSLEPLKQSKNVCVYLSMKQELQTNSLLEWLFQQNKRVFIPKVTGKSPEAMSMPELHSLEELNGMEKTKWGIPEFTEDQLSNRCDGIESGLIDFVLAPGVAFNADCLRLGHGGGYYDNFLTRLQGIRSAKGLKPAFVLGIGLDEQIVDAVPVSDHDVTLDGVLTSKQLFLQRKA